MEDEQAQAETDNEQVLEILALLEEDVVQIQVRWSELKVLFIRPEDIDVLNQTAAAFFWHVRTIFSDDVIMAISRLTDEASQGRGRGTRENLTFKRLLSLLDDGEVKARAHKLYDDREEDLTVIRKNRDKRLGHNDLPTILSGRAQVLPHIPFDALERVLKMFRDVLHLVAKGYGIPFGNYENPIVTGGAADLLVKLRRATVANN